MGIEFLLKLDADEFGRYAQAQREAGWEVTTEYKAVPYTGAPMPVRFELRARWRLFSTERVAVGQDAECLKRMWSYIRHHPAWRWKLTLPERSALVRCGDFAVIERRAINGSDPEELAKVVMAFGGDQADADYMLNHVEDEVLGYTVGFDADRAQALAEVVHTGATTPISRRELIFTLESFEEVARTRAADGDSKWEGIANVWGTLADRWGKTKEPLAQRHIEENAARGSRCCLERLIRPPEGRHEAEEDVARHSAYYGSLVGQDMYGELLREYAELEVAFEPVHQRLSRAVRAELFRTIYASEALSAEAKLVADLALMAILDGSVPSERGTCALEAALGSEFAEAIRSKGGAPPKEEGS